MHAGSTWTGRRTINDNQCPITGKFGRGIERQTREPLMQTPRVHGTRKIYRALISGRDGCSATARQFASGKRSIERIAALEGVK
jgi:hypothetical protein